jgi:hypothetical protein
MTTAIRWLKLSLTLALGWAALWLAAQSGRVAAFSGGPDPGRTGAPGELTCATGECHGTARFTDAARFRLAVPREYWPGQTYQIEIQQQSADPTRLRWGFQLTALTDRQQRAGEWRSRDALVQVVEDRVPGSARQYAQHTLEGSLAGQSGGARWLVDWTAPPVEAGPITFYAAGNQADGNSNSTGDQIFLAQAVSVPGQAPPPAAPPSTRPGSLLVFPLFSSSAANSRAHNTRFSLTNQHPAEPVTVHLYFADGSSGATQHAFLRLGPQQTRSLLASDYDPGLTGYLLAVAVSESQGCPRQFNELLGEAFIKLASGHTANLTAESFVLHAAFTCPPEATQAELHFDGRQYSQVPRVVAVSSLTGPTAGAETLLALLRWGGAFGTPLQAGTGMLYDAQAQPFSFAFNHGQPHLLRALSTGFLTLPLDFPARLPTGSHGWLKLWLEAEAGLLGAVLHAPDNPAGLAQGHRLHGLTLAQRVTLTLPVLPPIG